MIRIGIFVATLVAASFSTVGKTQETTDPGVFVESPPVSRSEEHTSELQSLMRNSYAVSCLKKKTANKYIHKTLRLINNTEKHATSKTINAHRLSAHTTS